MRAYIHRINTFGGRIGAVIVFSCLAPAALAKPGGEPLVLDTETGIHSGVPGTVLQTAPLGSSGMVPMATLPELQQQEQPPIVVSPYVEYSNGQGSGGGSGTAYPQNGRRRPSHAPAP
jgi:hypothetical protein